METVKPTCKSRNVRNVFPQFINDVLFETNRKKLINKLCELEAMGATIANEIVYKYDAIPLYVGGYEFNVKISEFYLVPHWDLFLSGDCIAKGLSLLELLRRLGEYK